MVKAVLFGGGGVTHNQDPALEDFLMTRLPQNPVIGHIGMANDDNPDRIGRVTLRFRELGGKVLHLPKDATADEADIWARGVDAVYVGGGNTARMLTNWRKTGIDRVLTAAARRGVVLSGVSAGAVAWFDFALWDGDGAGYQPLAGLGLIRGSCCPHFTTEPARAAAYRDHLKRGLIPAGYAIGDGAGLVIDGNKERTCIVARPHSGVWHISCNGADLCQIDIPNTSVAP
jgi:peptidase E